MIPEFIDGVNLAPGGHRCTLAEIEERFSQGQQRRHLCDELIRLLERAKRCGFIHALIGGSFATAKCDPKDLDITWFGPSSMTQNNAAAGCIELMDGVLAKEKFGYDMMFIPLAPSQPGQIDYWAHQLGFDAKAFKDRGTLILESI